EITLPFQSISVVENGTAFEGDAAGSRYRCVIATSSCSRVAAASNAGGGRGGRGGGGGGGGGRGRGANGPRWRAETAPQAGGPRTEVFSPDCQTVAFIQNYNVAIRPDPAPVTQAGAPGGRGGRGGGGGAGGGAGGGRGGTTTNYTMLSTDGSEGDAY